MAISNGLGMESILFQAKGDYPAMLDSLFAKCIENRDNPKELEETFEFMHTYILTTRGLNFSFEIEEIGDFAAILGSKYRMSVDIGMLTAFTPLNPKISAKMERLDFDSFKAAEVLNGTIDPANAKVSGVFSRIEFKMYISKHMLNGVLTPQELTAVALHEQGHAWDYCATIGTTLITSTYAAAALGQINDTDPVEKRLELGRALLKSYCGKGDLVTEQTATTEGVVAIILANQGTAIEVRTGRKYEAVREAEIRADQFVNRWGRGTSVIKTMLKLNDRKGLASVLETSINPKWMGAAGTVVTAIMNAPVVKKIMIGGAAAVGTAAWTVVSTAIFAFAAEGLQQLVSPNGKHPTTRERMLFLRRDNIAILKTNPPAETRRALINDNTVIDQYLAELPKGWWFLFDRINDYLGSIASGRRIHHRQEHVQGELINNRLYELSAILKR